MIRRLWSQLRWRFAVRRELRRQCRADGLSRWLLRTRRAATPAEALDTAAFIRAMPLLPRNRYAHEAAQLGAPADVVRELREMPEPRRVALAAAETREGR